MGLKPDWGRLMDEFKDSKTALVADVDCTTEGKELCEKHKVGGYPTIKYGDPTDLKDYHEGRDFETLKKFAETNLGPTCSPENPDLCNDENKALIEKYQAMDLAELTKTIEDGEASLKKIEDKTMKTVNSWNEKIAAMEEELKAATNKKDDTVAAETTKLGLNIARKVSTHKKKADDSTGSKKKKKSKNGKKEL